MNLRGWQAIDDIIGKWHPAEGQIARVLVGMQRPPHEGIKALYQAVAHDDLVDNATALRLKQKFAAHLKEQITFGIPTGRYEQGLRSLATQLRAGQVVVKLFLPYPLHAKLYLLFRNDINNPATGFVGSISMGSVSIERRVSIDAHPLIH